MTLIVIESTMDYQEFEHLNLYEEGDFSPFPSKMFALLYILLHSPNPIVSALLIHPVINSIL